LRGVHKQVQNETLALLMLGKETSNETRARHHHLIVAKEVGITSPTPVKYLLYTFTYAERVP
jgi:hypothetical protein